LVKTGPVLTNYSSLISQIVNDILMEQTQEIGIGNINKTNKHKHKQTNINKYRI